jgi:diacylglycerol kinase family enzyme
VSRSQDGKTLGGQGSSEPESSRVYPEELAISAAAAANPIDPRPAPWVGIAANGSSGLGRSSRLVRDLVGELRRVSIGAVIAWTPQARSRMVERAAGDPQCRCLVAVGGDGTVSALLNYQPRLPLTILPAGTENLVAQHFGLRRDPRSLAQTIARGRTVRVDVGLAGGRRFLLMAGFGFDADVVRRHHRGRLSRSGRIRPTSRIAYVDPILRSSFTYRFPKISIKIADSQPEEVLRGTTVFVFNLPRYALGLPFAPLARDNDGWLDLVVFREPGPFQALYYLLKVWCGIHLKDPGVFHRRVKKIVLRADEVIPVQLDGDPAGYLLPSGGQSTIPEDPAGQDPARHEGTDNGHLHSLPQTYTHAWTVEILPSALSLVTKSVSH